jgi:hypothetical protein
MGDRNIRLWSQEARTGRCSGDKSASELVVAKSHRQAASIAVTAWDLAGLRFQDYKVIELYLLLAEEGQADVGSIYLWVLTDQEMAAMQH